MSSSDEAIGLRKHFYSNVLRQNHVALIIISMNQKIVVGMISDGRVHSHYVSLVVWLCIRLKKKTIGSWPTLPRPLTI